MKVGGYLENVVVADDKVGNATQKAKSRHLLHDSSSGSCRTTATTRLPKILLTYCSEVQ